MAARTVTAINASFSGKYGGAWHHLHNWQNRWLIGYKSGGFVFCRPPEFAEEFYIPFYDYRGSVIDGEWLFVRTRDGEYATNLEAIVAGQDHTFSPAEYPYSLEEAAPESAEGVRSRVESKSLCAVCRKNSIQFYKKGSAEILAEYTFPNYAFIDHAVFFDKKLLVADVTGLRILDVSNLENITLDDSKCQKSWPKDFFVSEGRVYVADVLGIKIFSLQNPVHPINSFERPNNRVAKVVVRENLAFLACEAQGLKILDVSPDAPPSVHGGVLFQTGVWDVELDADNVYLAAYNSGAVRIRQTGPGIWEEVGRSSGIEEAIGVTLTKGMLFVAGSTHGLFILEPETMHTIAHIPSAGGRVWESLVIGDTLYIAQGKDGVVIYDIHAPSRPRQLVRFGLGDVRAFSRDGNRVWVAAGNLGIQALDVSNPHHPKVLDVQIQSSAFTREVLVTDSMLFKADGDGGFEIYSLD